MFWDRRAIEGTKDVVQKKEPPVAREIVDTCQYVYFQVLLLDVWLPILVCHERNKSCVFVPRHFQRFR